LNSIRDGLTGVLLASEEDQLMGRQGTVLGSGVLKGSPESRKRNVRIFAALLIVGVIAANVFAAAINFTSNSSLGVGTASIAACDADGFYVKPVTAWDGSKFMVTGLILGSGSASGDLINDACNGKTVKGIILDVENGSIGEISTGTISDTTSVPFSLTGSGVDASQVYHYAFEIAD
jgi:hypothetical protein